MWNAEKVPGTNGTAAWRARTYAAGRCRGARARPHAWCAVTRLASKVERGRVTIAAARRAVPSAVGKRQGDSMGASINVKQQFVFYEARVESQAALRVARPDGNAARATARGCVNNLCGFGRRLIARGSTRLGRCPTRHLARCLEWACRNSSAAASVSDGAKTQPAASFCIAAVKLSCRGETGMAAMGSSTTRRRHSNHGPGYARAFAGFYVRPTVRELL